jgi:hypothetical protein
MAEQRFPATFDGGSIGLSPQTKEQKALDDMARSAQSDSDQQIVMSLQSYWNESDANRKSGLNPREDKWRENLNLYWNRYDFSKKAQWQSKETMPEVPAFVDRFAAAMKEALISVPEGFYSVIDPEDEERDIAEAVERMTDVMLTKSGASLQAGHVLPFTAVFEEQCKLGALMAMSSVVTWKDDIPGGRVAIETVDPRFVWLDHTGRNMYRIRRIEIDRHELYKMVSAKDRKGLPIFKSENMAGLINSLTLYDQIYRLEAAGHGMYNSSSRAPITLDEYIATVVDNQGKIIGERSMFVVANQKFLIRGPEANPFWHGQDWLVYTPLVPTPLSVYGRTYMEDLASVAHTFTELTNLLLDAAMASSLNAWAMVPTALLNPEQVASGVTPNKVFLLEEGMDPKQFAQKLELGTLSPEGVQMWQLLKNEITEAMGTNEIGLGQFAPKSRTSATEINATQQGSSAIVRSVAEVVESRWLDITLDLVWKTGLQHIKSNNRAMAAAVGQDMWSALYGRRKELVERPFTFQARGISNAVYRQQKLKSLLTIFQIIGSSPTLAQPFFQEVSPQKFLDTLLDLSGIDFAKMKMSDRDKQMAQITQPYQQAQQQAMQGGQPRGGDTQGKNAVGGLAKMFNQGKQGQPQG